MITMTESVILEFLVCQFLESVEAGGTQRETNQVLEKLS